MSRGIDLKSTGTTMPRLSQIPNKAYIHPSRFSLKRMDLKPFSLGVYVEKKDAYRSISL